MALNMYLEAEVYIPHDFDSGKLDQIAMIVNGTTEFRPESVKFKIAYWCNASHIHRWFVNYAADGNDDPREVYVSDDAIETLADICREVLENPGEAPQLLPTLDGFSMETIEYDDTYFADTKRTLECINKYLKSGLKNATLVYHASW